MQEKILQFYMNIWVSLLTFYGMQGCLSEIKHTRLTFHNEHKTFNKYKTG